MDCEKVELRRVNAIIEAVLFAAGHALTYDKLSGVLGYPPAAVKKLVEAFAAEYNSEDRGTVLLVNDRTCQLCTKEGLAPYIREALGIRRGGNLSPSSLEVLAVIAYNEPVTRSFVDTVRGVDSSYAMSSLMDKKLIEPCGRLDAPGRPVLYRTTPDFLRCFGISSLEQLPAVDVPRADADVQARLSAAAYEGGSDTLPPASAEKDAGQPAAVTTNSTP